MFGRKVACVSLFTLLAATPLYGNWWSNWRSNQEKPEDRDKIRSEFENIFQDILIELKAGRPSYSITKDLADLYRHLDMTHPDESYRLYRLGRHGLLIPGKNDPAPSSSFKHLFKRSFQDVEFVQKENCQSPNKEKIKQRSRNLFLACLGYSNSRNKEKYCKKLAKEYKELLTGKTNQKMPSTLDHVVDMLWEIYEKTGKE